LASAFKEGKFDGRIRTQYFLTDWDMHDGVNKDATATGFAVGGSLIYKTAPLYGLSIGAGLYTTQNPGGLTEEEDGRNMTTPTKFNATTSNDLFLREGGGCNCVIGHQSDYFGYLRYGIRSTSTNLSPVRYRKPKGQLVDF
jgi:hypothetical protein